MAKIRNPITPFPRGWFLVAWSDELKPGDVKSVHYFGQELVVFRTEQGKASVLDAYCPHLGANLGKGGCVVGESIQCPFHRWRYGADGACVSVPYSTKIPPSARAGAWHVYEGDGMVLAWFHEEGAAPTWTMPSIPNTGAESNWTPWKEARWKVRTCIQDVNENDVDSAHLPALHQFTSHAPTESVLVAEGPKLDIHMQLITNLETLGFAGESKGPLDTTKYGLGIGFVLLEIDVGGMKLGVRTLGCTTPIDEHYVDVRLNHSIRKTEHEHVNVLLEAQYFKIFKETVEQDIPIWENKIHLMRPALAAEEAPIATYRKWARQFYSPEEFERALAR